MAKFILLPVGGYNQKTQEFERTPILVNLDRIIRVVPEGETACRVTLAGGNVIGVCRRFDTLSAQILNRDDLSVTYRDEEVVAAFTAGYNKARAESGAQENEQVLVKRICRLAAEWLETHPLSLGWKHQMKKDIKAALKGEDEAIVEEKEVDNDGLY